MWAICEWVGKNNPEKITKEDLKKAVDDVVPIYLTKGWSKSFQSIFPNNPVINPSVKKEDKKKRFMDYLNLLIDSSETLGSSGCCVSCGQRDTTRLRKKDEIPLLGSGGLINFFPMGQEGADYCPTCTFAVQFAPLSLYSCFRLLLLHSNSEKVMKYWSRKAISEVRGQVIKKDYTGCFDEGYKNAENAMFHIIQDIILEYDEKWLQENPSIIFYRFTNYIQTPDLEIYRVPTPVFRFLSYVKQHHAYSEWQKVVRKGYVNINWDKVKAEGDYRNKRNKVYFNLLNNHSITGFFVENKGRKVIGDWSLFSYYLEEVRNMDKKRLATLKKVGDELSEYIKKTENITRLNQLEMAKKYYTFRNILRKIIKERVKIGEKTPLFSLEEYVEDLFPEGAMGWNETRDILLFRIYENLHGWLISRKDVKENVIEEEMEEE